MIELTRLSHLQRAIVAGSGRADMYLVLRRRGFIGVATPETCRMAKGLHAVGLITGQNSLQAIEAALAQLSQFLSASAAIAVLADSRESGFCLKIRARLEQMAFGSKPVSGASRALCYPPIGMASVRWKAQRECHDIPNNSRHLVDGLHPRSSYPV